MQRRRRALENAAGAPRPVAIRTAALRLLARRDYTAHEVRKRLIASGYPAEDADALIADLAASHWLDDQRVAASHARVAGQIKGRGRFRIEQELAARGVDRATIRQTLGDARPDDEIAAIETVLKRKRTTASLDPAARRRLFQHLLRRGFSAGAITKVLRTRGAAPSEGDDDGT